MIAYLDTSALLRVVLRESSAIEDLRTYRWTRLSELIAVESARTNHRLRHQGALTMDEAAERTALVNEWLKAVDLVLLRPPVLSRATEPMPMPIGTLDGIHLATALIWRERFGGLPQMLTHDGALGAAARAFGFEVRGT